MHEKPIQFEFHRFRAPYQLLNVYASEDGSEVILRCRFTGDEVEFEDLELKEKKALNEMVQEWVDHFAAMREEDEPHRSHPANDAFGPSYVNWLNETKP